MRTCFTLTLLIWASLASQAQSTVGALPVRVNSAGMTTAAIHAGQVVSKAYWLNIDQSASCISIGISVIEPNAISSYIRIPQAIKLAYQYHSFPYSSRAP